MSAFEANLEQVYAAALRPYDGPISVDALTAEAEQVTGLSDWGGEAWSEAGFRTRLAALCAALEGEAQLTPVGRSRAHSRLHLMLVSRLRVLAYRKTLVKEEAIVAPLIGTGMGRTGTSFLHQLLAQDPDNLSAHASEAMIPVPPPGALGEEACRADLVRQFFTFQGVDAPEVNAVHPFDPLAPEEDVLLQEAACGSLYQAFFAVPSYLPVLHAGMADLYQWQKGMMQLLQSAVPAQRWALKAPEHIANFDTMWQTFPDARVYVNHRDPAKTVSSIVSLFTTFQRLNTTSQPIDPKYLGLPILQGSMAMMEAHIAWRKAHPDVTLVDVHYRQLVADPIGEAERVYAAFGLTLTAKAKQCMEAFLKVNRHGQSHAGVKHEHRLEDCGLTEALVEETCARYIEHFGVERERRR